MVASTATPVAAAPATSRAGWYSAAARPLLAAGVVFVLLFAGPMRGLLHEWLTDANAGQGLLLAPVAIWLAWRARLLPESHPDAGTGLLILAAAIVLRIVGALAAELFSQRVAMWLALVAVVVYYRGWQQVRAWWLPLVLLLLAIPLPALITERLALPLQFEASRLGTALIAWRRIPVHAFGNVIVIPGQQLFVAEACSGLRSMSALIAMGVMIGALYLGTLPSRGLLILAAIPVAVAVNAFRIFLTAFLSYFVDPALGQGFMHMSEGWALFLVAVGLLAAIAWIMHLIERRRARRGVR